MNKYTKQSSSYSTLAKIRVFSGKFTTPAHNARAVSLTMNQLQLKSSYFVLFSFVVCNSANSNVTARNTGIWDENNHCLNIILLNSTDSTQDIPIICYTVYR